MLTLTFMMCSYTLFIILRSVLSNKQKGDTIKQLSS